MTSMPTDGRYGWYKDHDGNEFQRVSTLIKKVETDSEGLEIWKRKQVAIGLSLRDDLILSVKAAGRPDPVMGWSETQNKRISAAAKDAMEAAKERDGATVGTAVHDLTERLDRGEDIESVVRGLPFQAERDLRAYAHLITLNAWKVIEIERTVVNDDLDVAGTLDREYVVPGLAALLGPGDCQYGHEARKEQHAEHGDELAVIGDVKTERAPAKNGLHIGPQLATYSRAKRMWEPGRYVPAPCVRQDVAVVVHIRDGHAVPYFVDLTAGWEAARAAKTQAGREKAAARWLAPMPNIREAPPVTAVTEMAVAHQYADPYKLPALEHIIRHPAVPATVTDAQLMTLPQPWHDAVNTDCSNCASLIASTTRVDGTYCDETCHQCGKTAIPRKDPNALSLTVEQVAVQRPDGMVSWAPAISVVGLDDVDKQAIETIWAGSDLAALGRVWQIYTEVVGRTWGGRVAEAAEARRRQIECPQRALHTAASGERCACSWTKDVPA